MNEELIVLVLITLAAALVNGALGHGFSSLTVPVALLFYTNRLLNPALVLLEVGINTYVTFMNRSSLPRVWRRAVPIVLGLVPGVIIGAFLLLAGAVLPLVPGVLTRVLDWRPLATLDPWVRALLRLTDGRDAIRNGSRGSLLTHHRVRPAPCAPLQ